MPAVSPGSFQVSWSGSGGSGSLSYSIYVSDNGGAFTPWLTATTQTSSPYTGINGHTYGFYSVATDNVGNVQATPSGAQANTTINIAPAVTGISPASGLAAGGTSVIITGTGFNGATAVNFGDAAATSFTVNSDTQITAIDPAGSGVIDVTVVTVDGTSATSSADQFMYNVATTVSLTSNPVGPITQGTSITFTANILNANPGNIGTVSFYFDYGQPDQFQIGGAVNVSSGSAISAATTALPAGSDSITAIYSGGVGFDGGQATLTIQVVTAPGIANVVIDQDISALYNAAGQPSAGAQRSMVDDMSTAIPNRATLALLRGPAPSDLRTFFRHKSPQLPVKGICGEKMLWREWLVFQHQSGLIFQRGSQRYRLHIQRAGQHSRSVRRSKRVHHRSCRGPDRDRADPQLGPVAGSNNTEWAVTFSGNGVTGGSVANGAYTITVTDPGSITAISDSQALSLAGSGIGSATQSFFRLFGDINGDEFVNAFDNAKFKQALAIYNAAFDYDDDGFVNAFDNVKFKNDLNVNFSGFTATI